MVNVSWHWLHFVLTDGVETMSGSLSDAVDAELLVVVAVSVEGVGDAILLLKAVNSLL